MDFFLDHWGNIFSVIGVVVSVVGLSWAILEAHRARSAAQSAERATIETRDSIGRHLVTIDLERAVSLIQRLKLLHNANRWEAALEQYQTLRAIISDIIARYPELNVEVRGRLIEARASISEMENSVEEQISQTSQLDNWHRLNQSLNKIQSDLEEIASTMEFGNDGGD